MAKAFDTVDHAILLSKLKFYGFRGSSYDLLHDYLSDRQQRGLFCGDLPDWGAVSIRRCASRIYFRSFTFCLVYQWLFCCCKVFIIGSVCWWCWDGLYSHSDLSVVEARLQYDLDDVTQWLCSSQLCLNVAKSTSMLIGSHQRISNKQFIVYCFVLPLFLLLWCCLMSYYC